VTVLRIEVPEDALAELIKRAAELAAVLVVEQLAADASNGSPYLTVAEAADLLRAKPQRVYDLLSDGRLTRRKDGSRVLVSRAELVAHLSPEAPGRGMAPKVSR
jgi:excisionase family DNA binding protein